MKRCFIVASLAALALSAGAALAGTQTFSCGGNHYLRNGGAEIITSAFAIRNHDPKFPATLMRLTIRNIDGNVIYDAGPAIGVPYPLSFDFPVAYPNGKDITVVPPLGATALRTNQIWGNSPVPNSAGGPEMGQLITLWIVVSKEGSPDALAVGASQRVRSRDLSTGREDTVDSNTIDCRLVNP